MEIRERVFNFVHLVRTNYVIREDVQKFLEIKLTGLLLDLQQTKEEIEACVRAELIEKSVSDCPVSEQRLDEIRDSIVRSSIARRMAAPEYRVKDLLNALDWAFSRITMMAIDNGYHDGFRAGYLKCKADTEMADKFGDYEGTGTGTGT